MGAIRDALLDVVGVRQTGQFVQGEPLHLRKRVGHTGQVCLGRGMWRAVRLTADGTGTAAVPMTVDRASVALRCGLTTLKVRRVSYKLGRNILDHLSEV